MRGRRKWVTLGGVAVVVAALAVAGVLVFDSGANASATRIVVSNNRCATGWSAPKPGRTVFTITNRSASTIYEIELDGGDHVSVYGQIEMLAPGTSDTIDAVLSPGNYTFVCDAVNGAELSSRPVVVRGRAVPNALSYEPVTSDQMRLATEAYDARIEPMLGRLVVQTDALARAVDFGNVGAARARWLPAHLEYERLGAAYGTFGALDAQINGKPLGLAKGVHDPSFQGFLRLEYGLWHGQSSRSLEPVAARLDAAVRRLHAVFPKLLMPSGDLALRAHEILENTLQFVLTGETDEGSHTSLATAWANVQGTQLALRSLEPVLTIASPQLVRTSSAGLQRLSAELLAKRSPQGRWVPLSQLTTAQREHLDSTISGLLERLSLIPDRLELSQRPPEPNQGD